MSCCEIDVLEYQSMQNLEVKTSYQTQMNQLSPACGFDPIHEEESPRGIHPSDSLGECFLLMY